MREFDKDSIPGCVTVSFPVQQPSIKQETRNDMRSFNSGAVRDTKGKGRIDLVPIYLISESYGGDPYLDRLSDFQKNQYTDIAPVKSILEMYIRNHAGNKREAWIDVSKHYEAGGVIHGDHNWEKGLPIWTFVGSAVRHRMAVLENMTDERHDRALLFNIIGIIYTFDNYPELSKYFEEPKENEEK